MEQWMFRITDYADELLEFRRPRLARANQADAAQLGRPLGGRGDLVPAGPRDRRDRTASPSSRRGPTRCSAAPSWCSRPSIRWSPSLTTGEHRSEVDAYIEQARRQNEIERQSTKREKTGVFTGAYAKHPFTGDDIEIWIADYVLLSYGTGAVMGVPAHDDRDFAFASERGIPIPVVIAPPDWDGNDLDQAYTGPGRMVNSGRFDGTDWQDGKPRRRRRPR